MTILIAPPSGGRISGGFRVNEALSTRLERAGCGKGMSVTADRLPACLAELVATPNIDWIVIDSLYLHAGASASLRQCLARRAPGVKIAFLLHFLASMNPLLEHRVASGRRDAEQALLALADSILVPGPTLERYVRAHALFEGPIHHCPPAIERTPSNRGRGPRWDDESHPRLITVGALSPAKGQLEILAHLQKLTPPFAGNWRWYGEVDGDPDLWRQFEEARAASGIASRVQARGTVPHAVLQSLLKEADLLVSASRTESFGIAAAEAVAAGVPVIAYRTGELPRWIVDGENGYLIANGDSARFQHVLARLISEPACLEGLRQNTRRHRPGFITDWEVSFRAFVKALSD